MYCGSWLCLPRTKQRKKTAEDYQKEVLNYIFETGAKQRREALKKIPFRSFGFNSDTDFVAAIPFSMIEPFIASQIPIVAVKEFKKHDQIVWKSCNRNVTERATFVKHSRSNSLQVTIRLEKKSRSLRSEKLNVPKSEITHYKDFLKSFLTQPPSIPGVTVIESHHRRSTGQSKVVAGSQSRKMTNNPLEVKSKHYGAGKLVYNKKTKEWARIIDVSLTHPEDDVSLNHPEDDKLKLLVRYEIVTVSNNEIKTTQPTRGGHGPLGQFMTEWEPTPNISSEQPTSSRRAAKNEENMETQDTCTSTKDVESLKSKNDDNAIDNREMARRSSKYLEQKVSENDKLLRKVRKGQIGNISHNKTNRNSSKRIKRSYSSDEKSIRKKMKSLETEGPREQETAVIPSSSSNQTKYGQDEQELPRNTICPQEVEGEVTTNMVAGDRPPRRRSQEGTTVVDKEISHSTTGQHEAATLNRKNSRGRKNSTENQKREQRRQSRERKKLSAQEDIPNSNGSREVDTTNRRNSRDGEIVHEDQTSKDSPEIFNERRKSHQDEISNDDVNKGNSAPNPFPAVVFEEYAERDRYDRNRGITTPKIKPVTGNIISLNSVPNKLANIQKELQHEKYIIPDHRKFSTTPGLFPPKIDKINNEIKPQCNEALSPAAQEILSIVSPHCKFQDYTSSIEKGERENNMGSEKTHSSHYYNSQSSSKCDGNNIKAVDPRNFIQQFDINRFCGRKGIQGRNNSCYLDSTLFSLFYCTSIFDEITLESNDKDGEMAKDVKRILRDRIVRPLRQNQYCDSENINDLRRVMAPLNKKINGSFMDAEELMFLLFEDVLKLKEFIKYSSNSEDFLHQIVPDPDDRNKCQTVQVLFENSLKYLGDMKFADVPNPALILEMPRSDGRLVQYEAIIPNLSLNISGLMSDDFHRDRKFCFCDKDATLECKICNGKDAVLYCESCRENSKMIHESTDHYPDLVEIHQKSLSMDLMAVICIRSNHYVAFVRSGNKITSPWMFFDSMAGAYPAVTHVEDLGQNLEKLGQNPNRYKQAINSDLYFRRILTDSHICIYHSHNIPSS